VEHHPTGSRNFGVGWRRRRADGVGGHYCENCHVGNIVPDHATITAVSEGVRAYALDPKAAEALWHKSEALVRESF